MLFPRPSPRRIHHRSNSCDNFLARVLRKFTFPNSYHLETQALELATSSGVSLLVLLNLRAPADA